MGNKSRIGLILGPLLFLGVMLFVDGGGMGTPARDTLAIICWVACWWITEAIPIPVTSLMPVMLFPLMQIAPIQEFAASYGHRLMFLFIGGFIIALAMERWNLHKRIALTIILKVGTNARRIILGFILATGFLSMWIANTATTMMMVPICMALVQQFRVITGETNGENHAKIFGKALILGVAYSASIGGMATLVGTPTTLIFAGFVNDTYGIEIPFGQWLKYGLPISLILILVCWLALTYWAFSFSKIKISGGKALIANQLKQLGPISHEEKWVLAVFSLVAFAWISRGYLLNRLLPGLDDNIIAMIGAAVLFIIPAREKGGALMDWQTAVRLPWGILLLFGGAFSIAKAVDVSGLGKWLVDQLALLEQVDFLLILFILVAFINFLTEITQNMATCTLILPVLAALAPVLDVHPFGMMAAACIASSCAFMLPFATAPNAIVFGTGLFEMKDMIRAGIWLNLASIILITIFSYWVLPEFWDINLLQFPANGLFSIFVD